MKKYCCAPTPGATNRVCLKPVAPNPFCRLCGTTFVDGTCPNLGDEEHRWWLNGQNALRPEDHTCQPLEVKDK